MFTHANIIHIFFNMYFLYMFGKAVENTLGGPRYLLLYLASGILAAVFHTVYSFLQGINAMLIPAVGASGAISGVLGAYMLLYPGTRLTACMWFIIPFCYTMPAVYFLLFWFALQVFYGYASMGGMVATVAFFAHAGGFLAGIALLPILADESRIRYLRYLSQPATSLFGVIVVPPWVYAGRYRLGTTAKAVFSLLTIALAAGGVVAAMDASKPRSVAALSISVEVEGVMKQGVLVLSMEDGRLRMAETSLMLLPDEARILVNRLYYSGVLYNPEYAGRGLSLSGIELPAYLRICDSSVRVMVFFRSFVASYDDSGLIAEGRGEIVSPVVYVFHQLFTCRWRMGEPKDMVFEIRGTGFRNLSPASLPYSLAAVLVSLAALYTIVYRDRDLVITPL